MARGASTCEWEAFLRRTRKRADGSVGVQGRVTARRSRRLRRHLGSASGRLALAPAAPQSFQLLAKGRPIRAVRGALCNAAAVHDDTHSVSNSGVRSSCSQKRIRSAVGTSRKANRLASSSRRIIGQSLSRCVFFAATRSESARAVRRVDEGFRARTHDQVGVATKLRGAVNDAGLPPHQEAANIASAHRR